MPDTPTPAPAPEPAPADKAARPLDTHALQGDVIEALRGVYDPEIPVNIYDLGLVYEVDVKADGYVLVKMTLTSPACPVAETLPGEVEMRAKTVDGVSGCEVELTWDPPWDPSKMSEDARTQLGFMGF